MTSIGSRGRKRGWLAVVASAAVLTTGTGVAVASSGSASPVAATPAVASAAGGVRVVSPGERIVFAGNKLWLTAKGLALAPKSSSAAKPEVLRVAGARPGQVSTIAHGDTSGTLWVGIYRGPVTSTTKVTLKLGARTVQAKVVTLAGEPGWGAFYVFDAKVKAYVEPSITVQS